MDDTEAMLPPESVDFGALQALLSIVNLPPKWGSVVISAVVIFMWLL